MKTFSKTLVIVLFFSSLTACIGKTKNPEVAIATQKINALNPSTPTIKVALLLDTSNSMDGLIDQAKAQLWELVNELSYAKCKEERPNLQIALYQYGNDGLNEEKGFIKQILPFSKDLDEISKQLFSLTTNGGSEYCGHVIHTSIKELDWNNNPDDLKLIFIAGNEPFTQGKINYKEASKLAHSKNISVNTIYCGNYEQGIATYWKDGADLTHGDYMAINHNRATVFIPSPYDDRIVELNHKLNATYIAYGHFGYEKAMLQKEQDKNAESYSAANAVKRAISKSSHLYKNESWDLVDAEEQESFSYDTLKKEDLPKELKGKTNAEIKTYIARKRKERETITAEIKALNTKRKEYLATHNKNKINTLENAMVSAIKRQAKSKNYTW